MANKEPEESAPASASGPDAPVGPSSEEEAVFLAEEQENGFVVPAPVPPAAAIESQGGLPPMEDLVRRIPMPTRDLLEELFRAKFVTVKRVPQSALK